MTYREIPSLEDKIMYCQRKLDENNLRYKKQDLKDFANVPLWKLKNMTIKLIIDCKSNHIELIDKQILKRNKDNGKDRKR